MPQFEIDIKSKGIGFVASVKADNETDALRKLKEHFLNFEVNELDIDGDEVFDAVVFFYPDEFGFEDIEQGYRPERET